ncbi:MAG: ABC transporter ATP-binding protein/permease [Ruminococcus sp.]|nr:ABC transporter ATP-binding protein/permease [Ruminococcus sp.]MCD7811185.1 ABC transporter ATP-binding protein/permease [Ruminococcus sp.]
MIKIFKYMRRKEIQFVLLSVVFIVVQVWLDLKLPDYMSEITQLVQTDGSEMSDVWIAGGKMLACALGSLVSAFAVGFFAARVAAGFSSRLRSKMFNKVGNFSMEEINNFSTASLITRSTNDITQIQMFIAMGLQAMVKAPIMAVWAICKILGKGWQWTAATGGAVVFLIAVIGIVLIFAMPRFRKVQYLTDNLNRVTRENLTGIRVVRAYNAEDYQEDKFNKANDELTRTNTFAFRFMALMSPSMNLVMSGISLVIYWIGAYLINDAESMDKLGVFSDMVVFSSYAVQVIMSFVMLAMIFIMLPRASVSAKRINEVLDTTPNIVEGDVTETAPKDSGCVEFRNVSFHYPDAVENVLENISFTAKKGETVAFIGSTGSGKSTLVNLIPRFYDATDGEVLVDGVNVKDYKLESLNNKLGYVSQKAVMFSGTVASNVSYGESAGNPEFSLDEVKKSLDIAQGTEFVEKMPGTYDAPIAQGGTNISGGQKQRLSIARAVYRKPEILIFDDSFSALDYKTDRVLRTALKKETKDVTTLIVAQRIGTIKDADRIIVLDEGKMAGMGTHDELMKNCDIYRQIALSQLSKEELENEQ